MELKKQEIREKDLAVVELSAALDVRYECSSLALFIEGYGRRTERVHE